MKTAIGGERLGSGNKQEISLKNFERSTHDLSYLWRSSMAAGTLVPFLKVLALPGDSFDIDLNVECVTLPTVGPLFGSYKIQCDVFEVPMRLYNAKLHMNKLNVGMDMSDVYLPQIKLLTNNHTDYVQTFQDNEQINPSCLLKYLGISGLGYVSGTTNPAYRYFNAVPLLAVFDIYKNYYANKQEEVGYIIHTDDTSLEAAMTPISAFLYDEDDIVKEDTLGTPATLAATDYLIIQYPSNATEPDESQVQCEVAAVAKDLDFAWASFTWNDDDKTLLCESTGSAGSTFELTDEASAQKYPSEPSMILQEFDLSNIDDMREDILQYAGASFFEIDNTAALPYSAFMQYVGSVNDETRKYSMQYSQEGLPIKTYQSDLFNNWIDTDWIDGVSGVNAVSAVSTSGDEFTIDALNLAQKVYVMLNRIAISGGTYDDWLDAVYTEQRVKGIESPVYHGSLIKELSFEEVISNAETTNSPLGTLAGRGRLTQKHKGGSIRIKSWEPSYIIGLVSITPRIEYSQGNDWDMNLETYDDFHKPGLDAIGFQDLIAEQMLWTDSELASATGTVTTHSVGKQPAWINYMTAVNKVYGNFADVNKEMFMVLNRRYEADPSDGTIVDASTYIDPTKFNQIFADTNLDAQNFWMQIAVNNIARRKMSAKVIPNL